jgi:predicted amidophosphoribosyltransferase
MGKTKICKKCGTEFDYGTNERKYCEKCAFEVRSKGGRKGGKVAKKIYDKRMYDKNW